MDFLDLYYQAFKQLRGKTFGDKDNNKTLKTIKQSNSDKDFLETKRSRCIIKEDWILAIEEGLPFIQKAIDEGRQFITNEGNVVPIERIKRVSKASTSHLARHSNLITHLPKDGEDVIPDQLFMEEKLSEFAVYENRFLYMLLCYLRDFVNIRYDKIEELGNSYFADFYTNRSVRFNKRTLFFELKFKDENLNDQNNLADAETKTLMERIEDIRHTVISLLSTELMEVVSKAPVIKPPITKTNVLKMDTNFKRAVALYEFVSEYPDDGYVVEEIKNTIKPFTDDLSYEFADVVNITSFLTYSYGNNLNAILKKRAEEEEKRKQKELEELERQEVERLKKIANKQGKTLEQYMLLLEKRNAKLQKDSDDLKKALQQIAQLTSQLENVSKKNAILSAQVNDLTAENKRITTELEQTIAKHEEEINAINRAHEEEIICLNNEHEQQMREQEYEYESKINTQKIEYEGKISSQKSEYEERLSTQKIEYENQISTQRADLERKLSDKVGEVTNTLNEKQKYFDKELERLNQENTFANARIKGLLYDKGIQEEDSNYTEKDKFIELEKEYLAFMEFFEREWKKTKKKIKKDYLGKKILSEQAKQKSGKKTKGSKKDNGFVEENNQSEQNAITDKDDKN